MRGDFLCVRPMSRCMVLVERATKALARDRGVLLFLQVLCGSISVLYTKLIYAITESIGILMYGVRVHCHAKYKCVCTREVHIHYIEE